VREQRIDHRVTDKMDAALDPFVGEIVYRVLRGREEDRRSHGR